MANYSDFNTYFGRWALIPDGDPIVTHSSRLLPVLRAGEPTMLKIATERDEKWGIGLMIWWDGVGAARVIEHDDDAILLERATGKRSLADMAKHGADDEASRVICNVVAALHMPRGSPPPDLIPLTNWFRALMAASEGEILDRCANTARMLLSDSCDIVPLHGDIHHGDILDFGDRGRLAIDPKRLKGGAASTTPTSSAIQNILSPQLPVASRGRWMWSLGLHSWSASGCCNGSSRGPGFRLHGSSRRASTNTWRRQFASHKSRQQRSIGADTFGAKSALADRPPARPDPSSRSSRLQSTQPGRQATE